MNLLLLRCHNMLPPHKWCVEDGRLFSSTLFFGTRKECEAFIRMQPPAGEKIRSTQDGSMEGASVTGQSPVDAPSANPRAA